MRRLAKRLGLALPLILALLALTLAGATIYVASRDNDDWRRILVLLGGTGDWEASALNRGEIWNLITSAGRLDLAFAPSGTAGFDDLAEGALRFEVYGVELRVAPLADIIRSKEAADRPQDRQDVILMREMLRRGQGDGLG